MSHNGMASVKLKVGEKIKTSISCSMIVFPNVVPFMR